MVLPGKLEREFDLEHTQFEESQSMKYVTSIERRGRAEGRAEGQAEGRAEGQAEGRAEGRAEGQAEALRTAALEVLEARFGDIPYELREQLQALTNETHLKRLPRLAALATDLDDFRRRLSKP